MVASYWKLLCKLTRCDGTDGLIVVTGTYRPIALEKELEMELVQASSGNLQFDAFLSVPTLPVL